MTDGVVAGESEAATEGLRVLDVHTLVVRDTDAEAHVDSCSDSDAPKLGDARGELERDGVADTDVVTQPHALDDGEDDGERDIARVADAEALRDALVVVQREAARVAEPLCVSDTERDDTKEGERAGDDVPNGEEVVDGEEDIERDALELRETDAQALAVRDTRPEEDGEDATEGVVAVLADARADLERGGLTETDAVAQPQELRDTDADTDRDALDDREADAHLDEDSVAQGVGGAVEDTVCVRVTDGVERSEKLGALVVVGRGEADEDSDADTEEDFTELREVVAHALDVRDNDTVVEADTNDVAVSALLRDDSDFERKELMDVVALAHPQALADGKGDAESEARGNAVVEALRDSVDAGDTDPVCEGKVLELSERMAVELELEKPLGVCAAEEAAPVALGDASMVMDLCALALVAGEGVADGSATHEKMGAKSDPSATYGATSAPKNA